MIRERLPGVAVKKLHKLLYFAQGHHLAAFGQPLFSESVSAWDMGPVVGQLWRSEKEGSPPPGAVPSLSEAQLNTIGYVLARYGRMSGRDLEILSHGQRPWQRADEKRGLSGRVRIEDEWMRDFFSEPDADDEGALDPVQVTAWLRNSSEQLTDEPRVDDLRDVRARIAALA